MSRPETLAENTFAAACYDQNSIAELEEAITDGPDAADCQTWGITEDEWRAAITQALAAKRGDGE